MRLVNRTWRTLIGHHFGQTSRVDLRRSERAAINLNVLYITVATSTAESLYSVSFKNCAWLRDFILHPVLEQHGHLTHIDLGGCNKFVISN